MRSTKLRQKIMAGILCAAMVFQGVSVEAVASEAPETVQSYDDGELDTAADETREDETGTDIAAISSEDVAEGTSADPEIPETIETPDGTGTAEEPDTVESSDIIHESEVLESPVKIGRASCRERV